MPLSLLLLAFACGPKEPIVENSLPKVSEAQDVEAVPSISVVEDPEMGTWMVTWTFPEPVAGISFVRDRNRFREENWTVEEDVSWIQARYGEVLLAEEDRTTFVAFFGTDTSIKRKDYELNVENSDGGQLLFTGHLEVVPMTRVEDGVQRVFPEEDKTIWSFQTKEDRLIHTGELQAESLIEGVKASTRYIYFGESQPIEHERVVILVDQEMPSWMLKDTVKFLPHLFDLYTEKLGRELEERPLIFISYNPEGEGEMAGGSLGNQLQFAAYGEAWEAKREKRGDWIWLLAHESFHLWNHGGRRLNYAEEEWLSEGSASWAAHEALFLLGIENEEERLNRKLRDASECKALGGGGPLLTAPSRNERGFKGYYHCGALMIDSIKTESCDPWVTLAGVFGSGLSDKGWSTYGWLEEVSACAQDPMVVNPLIKALWGDIDDSELLKGY